MGCSLSADAPPRPAACNRSLSLSESDIPTAAGRGLRAGARSSFHADAALEQAGHSAALEAAARASKRDATLQACMRLHRSASPAAGEEMREPTQREHCARLKAAVAIAHMRGMTAAVDQFEPGTPSAQRVERSSAHCLEWLAETSISDNSRRTVKLAWAGNSSVLPS